MPKRIQMSRQHPWRADNPDAVIVDRRTDWGNPYVVGSIATFIIDGREFERIVSPGIAVAAFRDLMAERLDVDAEDQHYVQWWERQLAYLAGHDLACWCDLESACHADVLLELANPKGSQ